MFDDKSQFMARITQAVRHSMILAGFNHLKIDPLILADKFVNDFGYDSSLILDNITTETLSEYVGSIWDEDMRTESERNEAMMSQLQLAFELHPDDSIPWADSKEDIDECKRRHPAGKGRPTVECGCSGKSACDTHQDWARRAGVEFPEHSVGDSSGRGWSDSRER